MELFHKIINFLWQYGLWATISKFYILIIDFLFDFKYGTETRMGTKLDDLTIVSNNKKRGVDYQATRVIPLKKLFNNIALMFPANGIFVDFGCGKGKVLLIASQYGFKVVRGVEFALELCEIAKKNCAVYKAKTAVTTEFQIITADVVDYVIKADENVFFMFNPFDDVIMRKLLNNIASSLKKNPRKILIIYYNPKYSNLIEQDDNFVKSGDFVLYDYSFILYSNSV